MAEITLTPMPTLGGAEISIGANRITERGDHVLVSIAIPQGGDAALTKALQSSFGLAMPDPGRSTTSGDMRLIWTAPDQMLLAFPRETPDAEPHVKAAIGDTGYTTDQTGGWVILDISGPETMAALERLCPLDLAGSVFPEGSAARTVMEHMGAIILRLGPDRFLLLSASSSAASFLHAVETSYHNVIA